MALIPNIKDEEFTRPHRYLEIRMDTGRAFHEPPIGVFGPHNPPPSEILFCDCEGVGVECHQSYTEGPNAGKDFTIHRNLVMEQSRGAFLKEHSDPACQIRRQIFVDVTDRPEATIDMAYDEKTDTFSRV